MSKRFDKIHNYRYPVSQPTVFDEQELTVLELVSKVAYKINETVGEVDRWIDYLEVFVKAFDKKLQTTVTETLKEWQDSGLLDIIINETLQTTVTETLKEWQDSGLLDIIINETLQTQMDVLEDETDRKLGLFERQLEDYANQIDFKIKNGIVNGNFADGTTRWLVSTGDKISVTSNTLSITGTGISHTSHAMQLTNINKIVGNKYYAKANMRVTNSDCTMIRIRFFDVDVPDKVKKESPVANIWYSLSGVITALGTDSLTPYIAQVYPDAVTASGKVAEVQNVLIINLTTTFGVGNEPSVEEMDELIKVLGGWFDGELALSQKQIASWQLNLIRQNRNAIISLGGTIV